MCAARGYGRITTPENALFVTPPRAAFEDDLPLHHHVPDQPARRLGKDFLPVAESVVRHDRRVELAREGEDEVVRVRAGRRLPDVPLVDEPLVTRLVVDLVAERGV